MIRCTVGVMAYNEEQSIVAVLHALIQQRVQTCEIVEILVVASGCTDRTVELAQGVAAEHPRITVDAQPRREGKAAAINRLMARAMGDVIVLVGADTLPDPGALEQLVRPFADPTVGMTGARTVPLNNPRTFIGFAVHMLWHVHHHLALRWPKLGELVAFRNVAPALPENTATDEVALEALISAQGYRLVYTPEAIVYNYGPETIDDFLHQRRRIFAGHLHIASTYGYVASSMPIGHLLQLAGDAVTHHPRLLPWMIGVVLLESWGRALGLLDALRRRQHHIWRRVASTKKIASQRRDLTLLAIYCRAGSVNPSLLLRTLRSAQAAHMTIFWWDQRASKVMALLPDEYPAGASPDTWLDQQLRALDAASSDGRRLALAYQVVRL